jgi:hypothetical protein
MARDFHVLHLYFGHTMMVTGWERPLWGQMDLPLWKVLAKRIFMTFQGCDARMRNVCAKEPISACAKDACKQMVCNHEADQKRARSIAFIARYCEKMFCLNPDLLEFVPGAEFLPYANLENPILYCSGKLTGSKPLIVHAPSDRFIKGTIFVEQASHELQASHPHDLKLVENIPRQEVFQIFRRSSILVDQLLVGWYGGVAVEGMAAGLPVVAYLNEKYLSRIPPEMVAELPIVSATPSTLTTVLAKLLESSSLRDELGQRGRLFVARWHNPVRVGWAMLELYRDPSISFWDVYRVGDNQ